MAIILDGDIGVTAADVAATTLSINAGYGSNAAAYGCRAWVNFNGSGTVAIRDSANVSSITDNGVGDYTVNFTTAMVDANYAVCISAGQNGNIDREELNTLTISSVRMNFTESGVAGRDPTFVCAAIIR